MVALKLIEAQEREGVHIAETARLQSLLLVGAQEGAARAAEAALLQRSLADERQKAQQAQREIAATREEVCRLEATIQATAGAAARAEAAAANKPVPPPAPPGPTPAERREEVQVLSRLQTSVAEGLRTIAQLESELAAAQDREAGRAGRVADLEARLSDCAAALEESTQAARDQAADVGAVLEEEEARHAEELCEVRAEADLCRQQVAAVEAELHSLITAYSTAKQQNESEKLDTPKKRTGMFQGVIAESHDDPLPAVDGWVGEGVLGGEVVRLTTENATLRVQVDQLQAQVQLRGDEERLRRQVEVLLAENQSLYEDLGRLQPEQYALEGGLAAGAPFAGGGGGSGGSKTNTQSKSDSSNVDSTKGESESDNERNTLLAEVLKSRQMIDSLTQKLAQVKTKSKQSALDTLSVMEGKMVELENELEDERDRHDRQLVGVLQAAGLYDPVIQEQLKSDPDADIAEDIAALFNRRQDEERVKVMTLKSVLMRFAHKLHVDELADLEDAGVILVAEGGAGAGEGAGKASRKSINFGSALCMSPSL